MMDEHTELQVEFNAHEKKIKELKSENIRIVSETYSDVCTCTCTLLR